MQGRTFLRIMLDNLFINNAFSKAISKLINFCNEQQYINHKKLKFSKKIPLHKVEKNDIINNKYIFTDLRNSGAPYK